MGISFDVSVMPPLGRPRARRAGRSRKFEESEGKERRRNARRDQATRQADEAQHLVLPLGLQQSLRLCAAVDLAGQVVVRGIRLGEGIRASDRKSTRLNSSHSQISYAVFCL